MQLKPATIRRLIPFAIPAILAPFACAAPLFQDNFDTDSSANWTVRSGYYEGSDPNDYTVDWAFDYSQLTVTVYKSVADPEPVQFTIPPAPNSAEPPAESGSP